MKKRLTAKIKVEIKEKPSKLYIYNQKLSTYLLFRDSIDLRKISESDSFKYVKANGITYLDNFRNKRQVNNIFISIISI